MISFPTLRNQNGVMEIIVSVRQPMLGPIWVTIILITDIFISQSALKPGNIIFFVIKVYSHDLHLSPPSIRGFISG